MKITKNQLRQLIKETKEEYQDFFRTACKKFDINPNKLSDISDDKKKKLFNYIDKNWNSKNENKAVHSKKLKETVKFNFNAVMQLIDQDNFLKYTFKTMKGSDKQKAKVIFNDHILGDSELEKQYKDIL